MCMRLRDQSSMMLVYWWWYLLKWDDCKYESILYGT